MGFSFVSNKVSYSKNDNGTCKIEAKLDIYDESENTNVPKTYIMVMDNAKVSEDQLNILEASQEVNITIDDLAKGMVTIAYKH